MPLINTTAELKEHVEANSGLNWATIAPSVRQAERVYIMPAIGVELYSELAAAKQGSSLSEKLNTLLTQLKAAIAPLAMYLYIPIGELQISDAGIQRAEGENFKTAYKYQILNLRETYLDRGLENLEAALEFLEKNADDYGTWKTSTEREKYKKLTIRSGSELQQYYSGIRQPQRTYQALAAMIGVIEDITMTSELGGTFLDLKTKIAADTLSGKEETLAAFVKKSVAYYTIAKGLAEMEIRIDAGGVTIASGRSDNTRGDDSNRSAAEMKRTEALSVQCQAIGNQYLSNAIAYLNDNATLSVFPLWYSKMQADALLTNLPGKDINPTLTGSFTL